MEAHTAAKAQASEQSAKRIRPDDAKTINEVPPNRAGRMHVLLMICTMIFEISDASPSMQHCHMWRFRSWLASDRHK